jgi:hypothetical protein
MIDLTILILKKSICSSFLTLNTYPINFYSSEETLVKVGINDDDWVKRFCGLTKTFEIADDE